MTLQLGMRMGPWCRRFEVPAVFAASSFRNFKSKAAPELWSCSAPLLPKFVSEGAATIHELRKRGTGAAGTEAIHCGCGRHRACGRADAVAAACGGSPDRAPGA